jgi:hypothetical protein
MKKGGRTLGGTSSKVSDALDQESVLREKYQLLRQQKVSMISQTCSQSMQPKQSESKGKDSDSKAKLEAARKILATGVFRINYSTVSSRFSKLPRRKSHRRTKSQDSSAQQ